MTRDEFKKLLIKAQDTGFEWYTPEALAEHVMSEISKAGLAVVPKIMTNKMVKSFREFPGGVLHSCSAAIKAGDLLGGGE